jgi:hypothetical protein
MLLMRFAMASTCSPKEAGEMLELPKTMRDLLVEQLDEYCENLDSSSDTESIAESVIEHIEGVSQEVGGVNGEEVLGQLEASGELEASMVEFLEDAFASEPAFIYAGEEIVTLLEKACEIEWIDQGEEEDGAGLFGDPIDAEFE